MSSSLRELPANNPRDCARNCAACIFSLSLADTFLKKRSSMVSSSSYTVGEIRLAYTLSAEDYLDLFVHLHGENLHF